MAKILIVDDSPDLLDVFSTVLQWKGYEVKTVASTDELENSLSIFLPDLIFLDVFLRNEDGRELCKKIKEGNKNISIILISASPTLLENYEECNADEVLEKPFDLQTVIATVTKVLDKKGMLGLINTEIKSDRYS